MIISSNSSNYPMGSDNSDAPWNESAQEPEDFLCECEEVLVRRAHVSSSDYFKSVERGDDGECIVEYNTEEIDFQSEWREQHYSAKQLIDILAEMCKERLKDCTDRDEAWRLHDILSDCEGWSEESSEVSYVDNR